MDRKLYKLFFKAFSNRTRFEIIQVLKEGPRNVKEISRSLKFEQSRVSHNLKCLEDCGFVTFECQGKNKVYSLDKEYILPIVKKIDVHLEKYSERLRWCGILKDEEYTGRKKILNYEI